MSKQTDSSGNWFPQPLGCAVCCPVCGKMPTLDNDYQFCEMRLYHCCRHQPTNYLFMVEFKAVLFTSGAITENEMVEKLVDSWNSYCAHAEALRPAPAGTQKPLVGSLDQEDKA